MMTCAHPSPSLQSVPCGHAVGPLFGPTIDVHMPALHVSTVQENPSSHWEFVVQPVIPPAPPVPPPVPPVLPPDPVELVLPHPPSPPSPEVPLDELPSSQLEANPAQRPPRPMQKSKLPAYFMSIFSSRTGLELRP